MRALRILTHAIFLGSATLFSIVLGFGVYALLRPVNQLAVQLPVAVLLTLAGYLGFVLLLARMNWPGMLLRGRREAALALLGALLCFPLIFYPLHYITQGYVGRFENVLATWAFQLPVNALALWLAAHLPSAARVELQDG